MRTVTTSFLLTKSRTRLRRSPNSIKTKTENFRRTNCDLTLADVVLAVSTVHHRVAKVKAVVAVKVDDLVKVYVAEKADVAEAPAEIWTNSSIES